jgi:preprotein translocase subunit SecY
VSIIVQLLTTTWKPLEELSKEGESGRRVITKYTRWGTVVLAFAQGTAISFGLQRQGFAAEPGMAFIFKSAVTLAAGTAFIMWLGEQITEHGIGNGISMIICAGIVARMPATLLRTFELMDTGEITPFAMLELLGFGVVTVCFIVFVERVQRRIPVQYPKRAMGRRMTQAATQHMPLKLNISGVIPPIFASALLLFPATIAQLGGGKIFESYMKLIGPGTWSYEAIYGGLIIFFAYFYTAMIFDPNQIADNLKKNGGFIPSIRPGRDTADFLTRVLSRLTLWGSLYLCIVCLVPQAVYHYLGAASFAYFFGGTAVLIVVGVVMDTIAQIETHIVARNYDSFMSKGPGKIRGMGRATQMGGRLIRR